LPVYSQNNTKLNYNKQRKKLTSPIKIRENSKKKKLDGEDRPQHESETQKCKFKNSPETVRGAGWINGQLCPIIERQTRYF